VAGRIDSLGGATEVVTEASERRSVAVAWRASGEVRGRHKLDRARFDGEALLSRPEWGPVVADSLSLAEDRTGNFAVAFLQGPVDARRVVAAVFDKAATAPAGRTTTKWLRRSQPRLAWRAGLDLWGAQTFRVLIDNVEVGRTTASFLVTPGPVDDGAHRWRVVAVDRRGQETPGRVRTLRVDSTSPDVTVRVDGKRKRGQTLKFRVTAADVGGSGVTRVLVRFGDGTPTVPVGRTFAHRYRHRGSYTATVRVYDRAGNVERFPVRLRIRK